MYGLHDSLNAPRGGQTGVLLSYRHCSRIMVQVYFETSRFLSWSGPCLPPSRMLLLILIIRSDQIFSQYIKIHIKIQILPK